MTLIWLVFLVNADTLRNFFVETMHIMTVKRPTTYIRYAVCSRLDVKIVLVLFRAIFRFGTLLMLVLQIL